MLHINLNCLLAYLINWIGFILNSQKLFIVSRIMLSLLQEQINASLTPFISNLFFSMILENVWLVCQGVITSSSEVLQSYSRIWKFFSSCHKKAHLLFFNFVTCPSRALSWGKMEKDLSASSAKINDRFLETEPGFSLLPPWHPRPFHY